MKLELLDPAALARAYETDLTEAFPHEELKPLASMEELRRNGCYAPLCLREGEEPLGYILLWRHPEAPYFLIDYLCVPPVRRNGGIGARLLESTFAHYPPETVFLGESEAPTGDPARDGMIQRRLGFYARMGAKTLSYDCALFGVHFKTIAWCRAGLPEDGELLRRHQEIYRAGLRPEIYRKFIQLPLAPGEKPRPLAPWNE